MKNQLFDYNVTASEEDKAVKAVTKEFAKHGITVVATGVEPPRRTSGVSYREFFFSFSDNQSARFSVTRSGDVFEVKVNGRLLPIKNQEDHGKAILEVVNKLDSGRKNWQRKMDKIKLARKEAANSISTSRTARFKLLEEQAAEYRSMLSMMQSDRERLQQELASINKQIEQVGSSGEVGSDEGIAMEVQQALLSLGGGKMQVPIRLADLRPLFASKYPRATLDSALLQLERDGYLRLAHQDNPQWIKPEDEEAKMVVAFGAGVRHIVYLEKLI